MKKFKIQFISIMMEFILKLMKIKMKDSDI